MEYELMKSEHIYWDKIRSLANERGLSWWQFLDLCRLSNPVRMSVGSFVRMSKVLHVPLHEIMDVEHIKRKYKESEE